MTCLSPLSLSTFQIFQFILLSEQTTSRTSSVPWLELFLCLPVSLTDHSQNVNWPYAMSPSILLLVHKQRTGTTRRATVKSNKTQIDNRILCDALLQIVEPTHLSNSSRILLFCRYQPLQRQRQRHLYYQIPLLLKLKRRPVSVGSSSGICNHRQ